RPERCQQGGVSAKPRENQQENKMRRCCYTEGCIVTNKDRARNLPWLISFLSKCHEINVLLTWQLFNQSGS
ncbi:mCG1042674, partial [Mus musculus]